MVFFIFLQLIYIFLLSFISCNYKFYMYHKQYNGLWVIESHLSVFTCIKLTKEEYNTRCTHFSNPSYVCTNPGLTIKSRPLIVAIFLLQCWGPSLFGVVVGVEIMVWIFNCSWSFNQNHNTKTYSTSLWKLTHNLEQKI